MLDRVDATGFVRVMGSGRTRPVLLVCERGDEQDVEVVTKFSSGGCGIGGLIREALSAVLAKDLNLPVPEPLVVHLTDEFIDIIPDGTSRAQIKASSRVAFGSRLLPSGFGLWVSHGGKMSAALDAQALDVTAFDCWTTNADRRIENSNLLTDGHGFAMIDHELALGHDLINLFWQGPWVENALSNAQPPENHVFFSHLRGRADYDITALTTRLADLTDGRIDAFGNALPLEWVNTEPDTVNRTIVFLKNLRDQAESSAKEFKRAMS